jgi:hypothetical protein
MISTPLGLTLVIALGVASMVAVIGAGFDRGAAAATRGSGHRELVVRLVGPLLAAWLVTALAYSPKSF